VRLSKDGASLALPKEISREEAVKINLESQRLEAIEQITEDGTVLFTDKSSRIMKELLNYECKEMRINECEQRAVELSRLYNELAKKYVK